MDELVTTAYPPPSRGILDLSFVTLKTPFTDFWDVPKVEDWGEGNALGAAYGREAVAYARERKSPLIIATVMRLIAERGTFGAIETGFVMEVAKAVI